MNESLLCFLTLFLSVGQSADTDTLVASANAYLNALNKMLIKREKKSLYKDIEKKKIKGGV